MQTDKWVKYSFIESLLRGCGVHENRTILEYISQHSAFNWFQPVAEYAYPTIVRVSAILIKPMLADGLTNEQAFYWLGCAAANGFRETVLGQVSLAAAELMPPQDLVSRLLKVFQKQTNYGQWQTEQIAPKHLKITLKDDPAHPAWLKGAFTTVLQLGTIKDFSFEVTVISRDHKIIDITW